MVEQVEEQRAEGAPGEAFVKRKGSNRAEGMSQRLSKQNCPHDGALKGVAEIYLHGWCSKEIPT